MKRTETYNDIALFRFMRLEMLYTHYYIQLYKCWINLSNSPTIADNLYINDRAVN